MFPHGIKINGIQYGRDRNVVPYPIVSETIQRTADGTLKKEIAYIKQGIKIKFDYLDSYLIEELFKAIDKGVVDIEYYELGKDKFVTKQYMCTERPSPIIRSWDFNVPFGSPPKPLYAEFELIFEEV